MICPCPKQLPNGNPGFWGQGSKPLKPTERDYRSFQHDHLFGVDQPREGERKTAIVVGLTAIMMVSEIWAGIVFGSMALLADGLHMASHAVALLVTLAAYLLARRWASDPRFSFGTGKLNPLGGFASAVLLAGFAAIMAIESAQRLFDPVAIHFNSALLVAVIGLVVNGISALLLSHDHHYDHAHHSGDHTLAGLGDHEHGHTHGSHIHAHDSQPHDHNLRAAYLHVMADALTSILAIAALLAGKYYGAHWLDPVMGLVGSVLVARWSWGLLKQTGLLLLDGQADQDILSRTQMSLEEIPGVRVTDLHIWEIAPGSRAAAISIVASGAVTVDQCRRALPSAVGIAHATIEIAPA